MNPGSPAAIDRARPPSAGPARPGSRSRSSPSSAPSPRAPADCSRPLDARDPGASSRERRPSTPADMSTSLRRRDQPAAGGPGRRPRRRTAAALATMAGGRRTASSSRPARPPSRTSLHVRALGHPELTARGRLPMHSVPHEDRLRSTARWRFQLLHAPDDGARAPPGRGRRSRAAGRCRARDLPPLHERPDALRRPAARACRRRTRPGSTSATFEVPEAGSGRRIVLHVGAAESVLIVAVNGAEVGVEQGLAPRRRVRRHRARPARREHARV